MCGLCGAIGTWLNASEIERFQHLALTATFRGSVGGGVVAVPIRSSKPPIIIRNPQSLSHLVLEGDFIRAVHGGKDKKICLLMGHARHPTRGGYEAAALHPHQIHHITGMHNGTFSRIRNATVNDKEIDSREFFKHVAEVGIELAVKQAEGAYALTWLDQRAETLNFLRNIERPLFIGYYKHQHDTLYWHSEYKMLWAILDRDKDDPSQEIVIKSIPPDTIVSYRTHNSGLIKPFATRLLTAPAAHSGVPLLPAPAYGTPIDDEREDRQLQTMRGKYLQYSEIKQIVTVTGCQNCSQPSHMQDFLTGNMEWYKPREFMCHFCMYDPICLAHMAASGHVPDYAKAIA